MQRSPEFLDIATDCEQTTDDIKMLKGLCIMPVQRYCPRLSAAENEEESYLGSHEVCLLHKKANFKNFVYYYTTLSE